MVESKIQNRQLQFVAQPSGSAAMSASDFGRFFLHSVSGILTAAVFVIAGAKTAPRRRFTTAIILFGFWSLSALSSHVLVHLSQGAPYHTQFIVEAVGRPGRRSPSSTQKKRPASITASSGRSGRDLLRGAAR